MKSTFHFSFGTALLVLFTSALQAQPQGGTPATVCEGNLAPVEEGGDSFLQVMCGSAGVILGRVDTYDLVQLPSLDAAVAVSTLEDSKRAWLIMKEPDGSVALEEITGTIARLGGRGTQRNIDGLEIDLDRLNTGQFTALVRKPNNDEVRLDVAAMIERSRAIRRGTEAGSAN